MAGNNGFQGRQELSDIICNRVNTLFNANDVEIVPFGMENLTKDDQEMYNYLCSLQSNLSKSAMPLKFAPDYILRRKTNPRKEFYLEVKVSKAPLCHLPRLNEIQTKHPQKTIHLSDVGDIAREAWNAYCNFYPDSIILVGCSYNPKVLMAQFVKDIDCLYCHSKTGINYCIDCPVKKGELFPFERNTNARGSQTPHTNIDYSTFEKAEDFFVNLNMPLNQTVADTIRQDICNEGINTPSYLSQEQQSQIRQQLKDEGCTWL